MKRLIVVVLILMAFGASAQIVDKPVAGKGAAIGQTYIGLTDGWAAISNSAALGWDSTYWVGIHHQNRFMLEELALSSVAARIPARPGAFGVGLSHTGYSQYSVSRADVSYGMRLSQKFVVGVGLAYHHAHFAGDYQDRDAITASAGMQYLPTKKVIIGVFLYNPARASLDDKQTMPALLGLALTYMPNYQVLLAAQVDADTENGTSVRAGIEFRPIEIFAARLGYSSGNIEGLTAGIGVNVKRFLVDVSICYHSVLGITPLFSLAYQFD